MVILIVRGLIGVTIHACSMDQTPEQQIKMAFGGRVRALRRAKGLSQEDLALSCDLDRTYIGGVERGERNISLINIYKIARALDMSPREFFDE